MLTSVGVDDGRTDTARAAERAGATEPESEREVTGLRTRASKTFVAEDGTSVARVFAGPVHYRSGGQWREIDNELVASREPGFALRNAANAYRVDLPASFDGAGARVRRW